MQQPEPTVFVVDDDEAVRESIGWLVESEGLAAETFCSAAEFLQAYDPDRPGCLLLDVCMPDMSGMELQVKLASERITLPVIMVTGHGDVPLAVRAIKGGALDFIEKPIDQRGLVQCIRQALAIDAARRQERARWAEAERRLASLTLREREVLSLVVAGLFSKEIAFKLGISPKTIEVHRTHIMQKLGADSVADLVRLALGKEARPEGTTGL